jgi:hypothetical protein
VLSIELLKTGSSPAPTPSASLQALSYLLPPLLGHMMTSGGHYYMANFITHPWAWNFIRILRNIQIPRELSLDEN